MANKILGDGRKCIFDITFQEEFPFFVCIFEEEGCKLEAFLHVGGIDEVELLQHILFQFPGIFHLSKLSQWGDGRVSINGNVKRRWGIKRGR